MSKFVNIDAVEYGTIIYFPNSHDIYMKVRHDNGTDGVVALHDCTYTPVFELEQKGLGKECKELAYCLYDYYSDLMEC